MRIPSQKCRKIGINDSIPRIIPQQHTAKQTHAASGFVFQVTSSAKSLPAVRIYGRMKKMVLNIGSARSSNKIL
jgi:hypothetical protein